MITEDFSYGDLMYRRAPFVIPPYQRAYAWNEENLDDFIKDINDLVNKRVEDNSYRHFFGGIVCVDTYVPGSHEGNQFLVIDGQQRLATFAMVLALIIRELHCLSQEAGENNSAHAEHIQSTYLESSYVDNQGQAQTQSRLVLSKVDREFFSYLLWNQDSPVLIEGRESRRLLKQAWNKLHNGLIENRSNLGLSIEERKEKLLNLQEVLTEGCHMILIISTNESEAYRLFMTLNHRGRSLSAGDLLKSRTLELLEGDDVRQANAESSWTEILKIGPNKVEAFLRAYLPSRAGTRAGRLTLYDNLCDAFFNFDQGVSHDASRTIIQEIDTMRRESLTYNQVSKGEWPYEDSTISPWYSDRLNRLSHSKILKHTLCYPVLLAARNCLSEAQFAEIVQMLELFIFRYVTICKAHAGTLGEIYYQHCRQIRNQREDYSVDGLREDLKSLMETHTTDTDFENRLPQILTYSQRQASKILHFFSTIEDYRGWYEAGYQDTPTPNTERVFDISSLHVEHIYPQRAGDLNEALVPLMHNLGNLSFWSGDDNRAASNAGFQQKKEMYERSSISLNRDLATLDSWNYEALTERRRRLVDMAVKIFTV